MKLATLNIEIHDKRNGWAQGKYLVRCFRDVLWTNSIGKALEALGHDLENFDDYKHKEEPESPKWPEGPEIIDEADVKPRRKD